MEFFETFETFGELVKTDIITKVIIFINIAIFILIKNEKI
jgi:hypothetical protein